jgi:hypothetical protein
MLLICPRCQRANPEQALYCYHDGNLLQPDAVKGKPATGMLLQEFVFPSRRRCKTLEDFVQGCQYEWEDARELLRQGELARYFISVDRQDLARAARDAEAVPDADVALHTFLEALPSQKATAPRLDISPRRFRLNKIKPGEVKQFALKVLNVGKGLLQGKLTVSEGGEWLRMAFGSNDSQAAIKTAREQEVVLTVDTRKLAAPQSYAGRLTLITNGGIVEVPVRLDLGVTPFALAPFKGASSPRDLAERMRGNPKAAVPFLENGEIQNWFAVNNWIYPVSGMQAPGIAAVQQFFEAMELAKPPPLQLSEGEIFCVAVPPEVLQREVWLMTESRKWVYAQAETDVHWMRVLTPSVSGPKQAAISFEVDSSLMDEGQVYEGFIQITANAGQHVALRVVVEVQPGSQPFTRRFFGGFFKAILALLPLAG